MNKHLIFEAIHQGTSLGCNGRMTIEKVLLDEVDEKVKITPMMEGEKIPNCSMRLDRRDMTYLCILWLAQLEPEEKLDAISQIAEIVR